MSVVPAWDTRLSRWLEVCRTDTNVVKPNRYGLSRYEIIVENARPARHCKISRDLTHRCPAICSGLTSSITI
jgi:hypothetical protein